MAENTLIIFSSDNGPEVTSVVHMRADYAHDGARPWRGMKRDHWEGGHRVPFIVSWPGKVARNTHSNQLTSLTDVMATAAGVLNTELPENCAEDSFNMLPAWLNSDHPPIRPYLLTQAFAGPKTVAIRKGDWKYIDHPGSGGNRYENDSALKAFRLPDNAPTATGQLYNLATDPGETNNQIESNPQMASELKSLLEQSRKSGRSR